jgi:hypothetical protein
MTKFVKGLQCRHCGSFLVQRHERGRGVLCFVCCSGTINPSTEELGLLADFEDVLRLFGLEQGQSHEIAARVNTPRYCPSNVITQHKEYERLRLTCLHRK